MAGTEQLEKSLVVLAKVVRAVDGALEDGKITTAEWIGVAFKSVDLIGVIKNLKEAQEELFDLAEGEIERLIEVFKKEFDLNDDKAEEIVETIVELALTIAVSTGVFTKKE